MTGKFSKKNELLKVKLRKKTNLTKEGRLTGTEGTHKLNTIEIL